MKIILRTRKMLNKFKCIDTYINMKDFEKCTVLRVEYKSTSVYGNNSYWLAFLNSEGHFERGYTASNASCGYTVTNYRYAEGKPIFIKYHYTKNKNCIIDSIMRNSPDKAQEYADSIKE